MKNNSSFFREFSLLLALSGMLLYFNISCKDNTGSVPPSSVNDGKYAPASSSPVIEVKSAPALEKGAEIQYQLSAKMRISLNIYDSGGQIVRPLLNGAVRAPGDHNELWDGLDQKGQPLLPGEYSWKMLAMPGLLKTQYLLTAGTNYPDPVPDKKREQFREVAPGTHGGPIAVVADDTGIYVGASCTENIENYLIKLSPDGKRVWSVMQHVPWTGAMAMAKSGDRLLVFATNRDIWCYNAADGKLLGGWKTMLPSVKNPPPDKPDSDQMGDDFAANDSKAAVCYSKRGIVRWFDPADGKMLVESAGLKDPKAVAMARDGTTYAICGDAVLRLDPAGKKNVTVIGGLTEPGRLTVEANGDLLVAEGGASKQIIRLDPAGKRLATYGAKGGRKDGRYDRIAQESFYDVTDLSETPDGGFIVAEGNCAPRRVGRFDAGGKLVSEWYGGQVWAPWIAVDPQNPSTVFMPSHWGWIMRMEVDYRNKSWKVRSIHHVEGMADGLVPGHQNAGLYRAIRHEGKLYLVGDQSWVVLRVDDDSDQLVPAMVADLHWRHYAKERKGPADWAAADDQCYIWTDANGDGRPQRDEIKFFKTGGPWTGLPAWDSNGVVASGLRWPISGWNSVGAPILGNFPEGTPFLKIPERAKNIEGRWGSYYALDPETGGWFVAFNADMPDWGRSKDSFLVSFDANGKQRWTTGGRTIGSPQSFLAPGDIGCFRRIAGITHGCIVLNDFMEGARPITSYVWDRDGLWVGGVMDDIDRAAAPTWRYGAGGETLGTTLWTDPKTGEVLLFWHGYNDIRIGRVTGWDGWVRKEGKIKLSAAAAPSTPLLTEVVPGKGTGLSLKAWAWSDNWTKEPPKVQRLTTANEAWGSGNGPDGLKLFNGPSVRVSGEIEALHTGWHTIQLPCLPHQRWSVGAQDLSHVRGDNTNDEIYMEAGRRYPVEIEYNPAETHPTTNHGIFLKWATPRGTSPGVLEPIPVTQLYPAGN